LSIKGFIKVNNILYAESSDFDSSHKNLLKDNGMLDEDKRINVFAVTFNTLDWPSGRYYMSISAMNRPKEGPYIYDSKYFTVEVGKAGIQSSRDQKKLLGLKNTIIWKGRGIYAYFPSLMKLQDGALLTEFTIKQMQGHIDPGKILTMLSKDNGTTWNLTDGKIDKNLQYPSRKFNQVIISGWKYTSDSLTNKYRSMNISTTYSKPGEIAYLSNEVLINKSLDNGHTWTSKVLPVPDDVLGLKKFGEIRLKSGLWIISIYGPRKQPQQKSPKTEAYILRSIDDGDNWEFIYLTPKGAEFEMSETNILQIDNQNLVAVSRSSEMMNMLSCLSSDGGKSWSKPSDTGIEGYPPDLILLPDGRIVCVYGYRKIPMGIRGCVSYDKGRTWDIKNEVIIRDDGIGPDLGYPNIVQLNDGSLFTIYYICTDGIFPYIAGSHFILPPKNNRYK